MRKQICVSAVALMLLGLEAVGVQSQNTSAEDMIQQLLPKPLTRSYDPKRGIKVEGEQQQDERPTVNLYVNFDYDSADLKQDGIIVLDELATALGDDRLTRFEFLIGGHTDAAGSEAYNQDLSERRAKAVLEFLRTRNTIDSNRLIVTGFGESRPLEPNSPLDGINRRVQITNVSIPDQ